MSGTAWIFGEALVDEFPDGDVVGGAPLNVACHLNRLGWRVCIITRLGDDARGEMVRGVLRREGLSDRWVQVNSGATGWVTVETDEAGEPRYTIHEDVAWDRIQPPQDLPEAEMVYFGSLALRSENNRSTLDVLLSAASGWRAFDVNLRQQFWSRDRILARISQATFVKVNEEEWRVLAVPAADLFARAPELQAICITRGAGGAALHLRTGESIEVRGRSVEVVDCVGAGDAFCARLLDGLYRGNSSYEALQAADALAAQVVGVRGAMPPRSC